MSTASLARVVFARVLVIESMSLKMFGSCERLGAIFKRAPESLFCGRGFESWTWACIDCVLVNPHFLNSLVCHCSRVSVVTASGESGNAIALQHTEKLRPCNGTPS